MKISIITVLNTINYGSVLQTFATQKFFEKQGFVVEFVDYWRDDQRVSSKIKKIVLDKKTSVSKWIKKPIRDVLEIASVLIGTRKFRNFLESNIRLTANKYGSYRELCENVPEADIYATGSDQMWNSGWNQGIEKSFFLEYAPENKKRIAFATSIGKTDWEQSEANTVVPLIKKYDYITLREQSAVDLLSQYKIKGHLVLDPTLLFDKEHWSEYLTPTKETEPYLLVYQLHQKHLQADFTEAVKKIAERKNLKIKRVTYSFSDRKVGEKIVLPEIFEFMALIRDASFIVTDSFHGAAFSVNFNKSFAVLYPEQFSTRMDNLLAMTGLMQRRYTTDVQLSYYDEEIDYTDVNKLLCERRRQIENDFVDYFNKL